VSAVTARAYPALVLARVRPAWTFRLPARGSPDGLTVVRGGALRRLVHVDGRRTLVQVVQPARDEVLFAARAPDRDAGEQAIERVRRALGVDLDLRVFYERFRRDPLIGAGVRSEPWLRVLGKPDPFEALTWAICEQLIESTRAATIQRRLVHRFGRRCSLTGMRDAPSAAVMADQAPALLQSLDLSATRAGALIAVARAVTRGRIRLDDGDHERCWRALRAIRGIGSWTVQLLALTGQGRLDQLPAGDLAYLKLVGRLLHRDPWARASEAEVEEVFARYHPWAGLAGHHALRSWTGSVGRLVDLSPAWR
jgi:3-methyladenine DNA glycosylase/8-oxoguanine DNA glycosylase